MDALFTHLTLLDVQTDLLRNIVSIGSSQDLFDDLSDQPDAWALAQQVEDAVKPPAYQSRTPVIHRPFEDAHWCNAIDWPFKHWQSSRFSDGSFGVWYGSQTAETTVYETAYHWFAGLLSDAGFQKEQVRMERKLYQVACNAALLDFRPQASAHAGLLHKTDYRYAQAVGARLDREGHPGCVVPSVRHAGGENYAILNSAILSNPRLHSQVSYVLRGDHITVHKQPGVAWLEIATAAL